jgi:hypothetical protein
MLVSGGNDGTLSLWNIDGPQATKELTPKLSVKVVCFCAQPLQFDLVWEQGHLSSTIIFLSSNLVKMMRMF